MPWNGISNQRRRDERMRAERRGRHSYPRASSTRRVAGLRFSV